MSSSSDYPTQYECRLTLKNGREVFMRPVKQTDEQLIADLFSKLSPRSVYLRFLRRLQAIPQDMLYRFTHINYTTDFALVASIEEDGREAVLAVARYAYTADDDMTELAIAVRDDWQHMGLGKALMKRLVEIAAEHGIYRFEGMIDPQNKLIMQILAELGYKVKYSMKSGCYHAEIQAGDP